eukprot:353408-Chlamydomonas_euryale.AAC.1
MDSARGASKQRLQRKGRCLLIRCRPVGAGDWTAALVAHRRPRGRLLRCLRVGMISYHVAQLRLRPELPSDIQPEVAKLISECWADDPAIRPSFKEILGRLRDMREIHDSPSCAAAWLRQDAPE